MKWVTSRSASLASFSSMFILFSISVIVGRRVHWYQVHAAQVILETLIHWASDLPTGHRVVQSFQPIPGSVVPATKKKAHGIELQGSTMFAPLPSTSRGRCVVVGPVATRGDVVPWVAPSPASSLSFQHDLQMPGLTKAGYHSLIKEYRQQHQVPSSCYSAQHAVVFLQSPALQAFQQLLQLHPVHMA